MVPKWNHAFKDLQHIKGPPPIPIIGNLTDLGDPTKIFWQLYHWHIQYGSIAKACYGMDMLLFISEPEYLEFICTSQSTLPKGIYYRYLHNWLSFGLLTSKGKKWHQRRKMITPTYHFNILKQFVEIFEKNGNILIEKLGGEVGNPSFDVHIYLSLCALDSINETAMGSSVDAQNNSNTDYIRAIKEMTRIVVHRTMLPHKHFDFLYQFTQDYKLEQNCLKILHGYSISVIESRRQELLNNPSRFDTNYVDEFGRKKRIAFLDLLLQSTIDGKPLSNEEIQEEVDTFMFEGHDTVSACMSFWMYLISKHPEVEEKLLAEQREIFGNDPKRPATYIDLQKMHYMEMTIKETIRLYPSVPFMMRDTIEDFTFRDLSVKKGTQIIMLPFYLHRRADLYPEPEKFIPERFTAENVRKRHPFAYLGFSARHRNCIGQKFAMIELKSTLSKGDKANIAQVESGETNFPTVTVTEDAHEAKHV
ncbi:cytochrome P450 4c3-like [Atheta coriaria]|uniref:cytochrome P450 4c3-like n=1 Tax=Dalotia coriaria TaxID=877792 RepID=UPI0031F43194